MKARFAASVVLALGIAVSASGCTFITYQATTEKYDASDGISANVGSLDIRNALVVSDDGADGVLAMTVVNTGDRDVRLVVQFEGGTGRTSETVEIPANGTTVFGGAELDALALEGIDTDPGAFLPVYFQYGQEQGAEKLVPVLDGSLPEYGALLR